MKLLSNGWFWTVIVVAASAVSISTTDNHPSLSLVAFTVAFVGTVVNLSMLMYNVVKNKW